MSGVPNPYGGRRQDDDDDDVGADRSHTLSLASSQFDSPTVVHSNYSPRDSYGLPGPSLESGSSTAGNWLRMDDGLLDDSSRDLPSYQELSVQEQDKKPPPRGQEPPASKNDEATSVLSTDHHDYTPSFYSTGSSGRYEPPATKEESGSVLSTDLNFGFNNNNNHHNNNNYGISGGTNSNNSSVVATSNSVTMSGDSGIRGSQIAANNSGSGIGSTHTAGESSTLSSSQLSAPQPNDDKSIFVPPMGSSILPTYQHYQKSHNYNNSYNNYSNTEGTTIVRNNKTVPPIAEEDYPNNHYDSSVAARPVESMIEKDVANEMEEGQQRKMANMIRIMYVAVALVVIIGIIVVVVVVTTGGNDSSNATTEAMANGEPLSAASAMTMVPSAATTAPTGLDDSIGDLDEGVLPPTTLAPIVPSENETPTTTSPTAGIMATPVPTPMPTEKPTILVTTTTPTVATEIPTLSVTSNSPSFASFAAGVDFTAPDDGDPITIPNPDENAFEEVVTTNTPATTNTPTSILTTITQAPTGAPSTNPFVPVPTINPVTDLPAVFTQPPVIDPSLDTSLPLPFPSTTSPSPAGSELDIIAPHVDPNVDLSPVTLQPTPHPTPALTTTTMESGGMSATPYPTTPAALVTPSPSLIGILPDYTLKSLEEPNSPQSLALLWVQGLPEYENFSDARRLQLFALTTFYISFQGEEWTSEFDWNLEAVGDGECFWSEHVACNASGFYTVLELDDQNLPEATMPPEIALL
ncbi:Leucine Rich Repeat (Partial), partial [Seminavis robusta]|eukprot:Sro2074_g313500.1 Leucine Rich Repeat (748) ;mRNA; r:2-2245